MRAYRSSAWRSAILAVQVASGFVQVVPKAAPLFRRHPLAPFLEVATALFPGFVAAVVLAGGVVPLMAFFEALARLA